MAAAISGSSGCLIKGLTSMLPVLCLLAVLGELVQGELRRCYTCGPLAEQPHRSRRPPACATFNVLGGTYESECDPGHNACAIVASVHPYVESRICVKEHHEKCIRKYCNTTKTLKMVCSCQGDLCNAEKTTQINESFLRLTEDGMNTTKINEGTVNITKQNSTTLFTSTTTAFPNYEGPATGQNHNLTAIFNSKTTTPSLKIKPDTDVSNEEDLDIAVGEKHQPLPIPAALGGEQTPSSGQGAPVDDEEDTSEGSGRGFDAKVDKSSEERNGLGAVKTTVQPMQKATLTTTMLPNSAAYSVSSAPIFAALAVVRLLGYFA